MQLNSQESCFFYATSVTYPSQLANRKQILQQMTAFARENRARNILAVSAADTTLQGRCFEIFETKSTFLPVIVLRQIAEIRSASVTHIYCREIRLAFALLLATKLRLLGPVSISFEVHVLHYPQKLDSWLLHRFAKYFDRVITINSWMKEEMARRRWADVRRILVAHDAANPALFRLSVSSTQARQKLNVPKNEFVLVYTGRYKTAGMDKGLQSIMRILSHVIATGIKVRLYAVGGSEAEIEEYTNYANVQGVAAFCSFVAHLPQSDVALYHYAADVLMMPFPAEEHFAHFMSPLKLFEYLMAGRAIIATDLPSIRDVVDERIVYLIPPDSDLDLEEAIMRLAGDPGLRERLSDAAKKTSEAYTWDARARAILSFIHI